MKQQKAAPKELPLNLPEEGFDERLESIHKLTKRMTMLMREIEVYSLDMTLYSKSLARGNMPKSYVDDVTKTLSDASKELRLVSEAWEKIFIGDKNVADVPNQ